MVQVPFLLFLTTFFLKLSNSSLKFCYSDLLLSNGIIVLFHQLHQSSGFDLGYQNLWKRVLMGRVVFKRLVLALAKSYCPLSLSLNPYFSLPTKYRHFPKVSRLSPFSQFSSYPLIHVLCYILLIFYFFYQVFLLAYLTVILN